MVTLNYAVVMNKIMDHVYLKAHSSTPPYFPGVLVAYSRSCAVYRNNWINASFRGFPVEWKSLRWRFISLKPIMTPYFSRFSFSQGLEAMHAFHDSLKCLNEIRPCEMSWCNSIASNPRVKKSARVINGFRIINGEILKRTWIRIHWIIVDVFIC